MTPRRRTALLVTVECLLIAAFPIMAVLKLLALPYFAAWRLYVRIDAWIEAQS